MSVQNGTHQLLVKRWSRGTSGLSVVLRSVESSSNSSPLSRTIRHGVASVLRQLSTSTLQRAANRGAGPHAVSLWCQKGWWSQTLPVGRASAFGGGLATCAGRAALSRGGLATCAGRAALSRGPMRVPARGPSRSLVVRGKRLLCGPAPKSGGGGGAGGGTRAGMMAGLAEQPPLLVRAALVGSVTGLMTPFYVIMAIWR
jgi:hypothetical protein